MTLYELANNLAWTIKYSKKPDWFQLGINQLYSSRGIVQVQKLKENYIVFEDCKFHITENLDSLVTVPEWLDNIRPTDRVLNIGACIGSIAIPLAKKCEQVYALEPLWVNALYDNCKLNELKNVIIQPYALGKGELEVRFGSLKQKVPTIGFAELVRNFKPDYLVCDCEGGEWLIESSDLLGIREIRIEFHIRRKTEIEDRISLSALLITLGDRGYGVDFLPIKHENPSILFKEIKYFKASKKE